MNKQTAKLLTVSIVSLLGVLVVAVCIVLKKRTSITENLQKPPTITMIGKTPNYKTMGMCGGLLRVAEVSISQGSIDEKKFYFTCLVYMELSKDLLQAGKPQNSAEIPSTQVPLEEKRLRKLFRWGREFYQHMADEKAEDVKNKTH